MTASRLPSRTESGQTRLTYRGAARRAQILRVASDRFLAQGYAGVSVDEIINAVGGSKTNVYRQFGGKEGLFLAVIENLSENFIGEFKQINLSGQSFEEGLKVLASELLDILLQDRHLAFQRLIIAESARFPALGRAWLDNGPQKSRQVIARFIATQQPATHSNPDQAMLAATYFHDMIIFNPVHLAMLGSGLDAEALEHFIEGAVQIFLHGYT